MEANLPPNGASKRRGFAALASLALGASLPVTAGAGAALLIAAPSGSLTPVAQAYVALQAVEARKDAIDRFGATDEVVDAWCDDDVAAVEALAAAEARTPQDALLKVMAILRRGSEHRWNLMDCEGECLQNSVAELAWFFPEIAP